ncbi:MBL fold metallo-hydrolase [Aquihabitans sp. G128]|uniref:MBL fold metallo-hydrolase n=1 Tax=Aquihabitans sp. G128 TaxID=2849779 RepID=UPI001C214B39|nr:MBL fold metallo-hydrolase [Aquihabitans sp. G128]QXC60492.1 MBL fold metallo-hydrolase [Aquihabitans sp. G128]HWJ63696.1 MBL fold metallo-hydrolase [Acidimicrobiales bacterium]
MTQAMLVPQIDELPDGTLRATLPTPFPVGPVNCYLLLGSNITVVDPGMVWRDSTDQLTAFLAEAGLTPADVDTIVVTHGHPDHFGAAGWLSDRADAPVVCGRAEVPKLLGPLGRLQNGELGGSLGIPDTLRDTFASFYTGVSRFTTTISDHRVTPVDDLDTLSLGGRTWTAQVTPGHAAGHLSLRDETGDVLLSGDHLLGNITPNPVIEPDLELPDGRRRSLTEYLASLDRFEAMAPKLVLPGHGPGFSDVPALIELTRNHHDQRCIEVLDLVRTLGTPTPFDLSVAMFPRLEGFSHMLGISEALGHLDLLEDAGQVHRISDQPIRYQAA